LQTEIRVEKGCKFQKLIKTIEMRSINAVAANKRLDESQCCLTLYINPFNLSDCYGELFQLGLQKSIQFAIAASRYDVFMLR
jgi:hypothetical protein